MISSLLLSVCLLVTVVINAQQNRLKLGIIGLPFNQSGYVLGTIGYERLNKKQSASWQLLLNKAGGSFAADANSTNRVWGTVEKTFYFKRSAKKTGFSFSAFTEIGKRNTNPGEGGYYSADTVLLETKAFEINPGVNLGFQYGFSEIWGLEIQAGPKMIIANWKEHYYNINTQRKFNIPYNEIRAGFMFAATLYFHL